MPLSASRDRELRDLLADALREVNATEGSILLANADGSRLRFIVAHSPMAESLIGLEQQTGKGIVGRCVTSQQPVIVNDTEDEADFDPSVDQKTHVRTKSIMVVPLLDAGRLLGAVTAINSTAPGEFTPQDLQRYSEFAAQVTARLDLDIE